MRRCDHANVIRTRAAGAFLTSLPVFTRLAHSWHTSAIRLAARIWGKVLQQHISSTRGFSSGASRDVTLHDLRRTLPPHLRALLSVFHFFIYLVFNF